SQLSKGVIEQITISSLKIELPELPDEDTKEVAASSEKQTSVAEMLSSIPVAAARIDNLQITGPNLLRLEGNNIQLELELNAGGLPANGDWLLGRIKSGKFSYGNIRGHFSEASATVSPRSAEKSIGEGLKISSLS